MKKLIALALILTQQYLVFGQEPKNTIDLQCTTVIAVNGLNIREKPSKNSRIIDKIPFGEKIKYLSKYSFGIETIKDYPNVGNCLYKKKDMHYYIPTMLVMLTYIHLQNSFGMVCSKIKMVVFY